MPISGRNPSAQMLTVHGRGFLIDCGEGTQQQMRRCRLSFCKTEAVFISHIHGDHVFGLFGFLNSLGMFGYGGKLDIYGPNALGGILKCYLAYWGEWLGYEIAFHPLAMKEPEVVHVSKWVEVQAFPLRHKIDCFGFRFDERVASRHAGDADYRPFSYAYCSDTMPFEDLSLWVKGVSTLYHEATYPVAMAEKAHGYYHSTTEDAARCALAAGVGRLLVGHYSARITDFDAYLAECRRIFPNTFATRDGDNYDLTAL